MSIAAAWSRPADSIGLAVGAGAVLVVAMGALVVPAIEAGPFTGHMIVHIATMNVVAPLVALSLPRSFLPASSAALWTATVAQLTLFWALHAPILHHGAHASPLPLAMLHASLFLTAVTFWNAIRRGEGYRWQAILALALSGKVACLLGALLTFAPRPLFGLHAPEQVGLLADQQMAGILMLAACPLGYVAPAVILAMQAIVGLEQSDAGGRPAQPSGLVDRRQLP